MKCRLLHETLVVPSKIFPGRWRCRACGSSGEGPSLERCPKCGSANFGQRAGRAPAGTELEFPEAWRVCRQGAAVPADEECEQALGQSPGQATAARQAYEKVRLGVAPEDYEAYDLGLMRGYNPDGSWIPGPNYEKEAWEQRKRDSPLIIMEDE